MGELETTVELLKKELHDQAKIHDRLDIAIEKLTDVSNSIHRMLAVHEEKLTRQEEAILSQEEQLESRRLELSHQIQELHSRITTSTKEMTELMTKQHIEAEVEIRRLREDITNRVGVLERWKYLIIGGSIVVGFVLNAYMKHIM